MWLMLLSCDGAGTIEPPATPPAPPEVAILPDAPVWGRDPLVCETDGVEVRWEVDGVAWEGGATVPADATRAGRTWTCTAVSAEGATANASVEPAPLASNILLFLLDDIGVEKVQVYGRPDDAAPQTPVIDGLAAEGVRFHRAWSTPVCSTTRSTIMTGRWGRRTGLGRIIDDDRPDHILAYDELFVPEMLAYAPDDYSTAMVGKWHLAWIEPQYVDHPSAGAGFDFHAGSMDNLGRSVLPSPQPRGYFFWEENFDGELTFRDVYATRRTINVASQLTHTMPEPWFLYVPFNGAHVPYHDPPDDLVYTPAADDSDPERFRAMAESIDIAIGQILDAMDPQVRAQTTVLVVGDNGTAKDSTLPRLPFAKGSVLEPGVRVPFVVAGNGVTARGVSHALVHTSDLFTTIAAIAGVDLDAMDAAEQALPRDSASFLPALADVDAPGRAMLYTEAFRPNGPGPYDQSDRAVTDGRFKLAIREGVLTGEFLFDLESPEEEGLNLYDQPLSAEAAEADERLRAELGRLEGELVYDSPL